jgi:hypothetical protein
MVSYAAKTTQNRLFTNALVLKEIQYNIPSGRKWLKFGMLGLMPMAI